MKLSEIKLSIFLISTFFLFFLLIEPIFACGPFFPRYIYTPEEIEKEKNPFIFVEINSFLNSHYQIISSGWNPQYLYPVYRELTNNKISQQEKEELSLYYHQKFFDVFQKLDQAITSWKEARKLVTQEDVEIETYKCENYSCYLNCLPDSFLNAAKTLKERSQVYNRQELKKWLEGQDHVFSNCGTPKKLSFWPSVLAASFQQLENLKEKSLLFEIQNFSLKILTKINNFFHNLFSKTIIKKSEPKISSQELLKYDQEYQKGASYFYKGNFEEAEKIFKDISHNQNHPWRVYAALSLGRVYLRKGQFEYEEILNKNRNIEEASQVRRFYLEKAKIQFENILKDESLKSIHEDAKLLLNYINFRIDPEKRFQEAETILLTSHNPQEIIYNLEDFSLLFSQFKDKEKFILENGDFSKWLYVWQNQNQNNLELALKNYQQTKSLPWLLASLKLMTPQHPLKDEIIKESLKIPKESPAYLTANYYRLKILINEGKNKEEIRKDIDKILKTIPDEFSIAKNYYNKEPLVARIANSDGDYLRNNRLNRRSVLDGKNDQNHSW